MRDEHCFERLSITAAASLDQVRRLIACVRPNVDETAHSPQLWPHCMAWLKKKGGLARAPACWAALGTGLLALAAANAAAAQARDRVILLEDRGSSATLAGAL